MNRESEPIAVETQAAGPVASDRRIGALDLARGIALFGILLVNVQSFNLSLLGPRPDYAIEATDGAVQWAISTFAEGKFWTLFSILFGMGFAVMLERAGTDGRGFVARYLRRTFALAAFGVLHIVLIWTGDILFNYAAAALLLLAMLFCGPWLGLVAAAVAIGAARWIGVAAGDMFLLAVYAFVAAVYLRNDSRWRLALTVAAGAAAIASMAAYGSSSPAEAKKAAGYAAALLIVGVLGLVARGKGVQRLWRAGAWLLLAPMLASAIATSAAQWVPAGLWPSATPASEVQRMQRRFELRARGLAENKTMSEGSYADAVRYRTQEGFKRPMQTLFIMCMGASGLFLIGIWLVRSGAARWPERHKRLWRGLAWIGFPLGLASVLGGEWLIEAVSASKPLTATLSLVPEVGATLMALGYLAFAFLLASRGIADGALAWVASTGRMALTNYLMQSVLATWFFYGYGLGFWGLGRTWQAVFVLAVFVLQAVVSRWWLSKRYYGPMEWLWRWITYLRRPPMRIGA